VPLTTPWLGKPAKATAKPAAAEPAAAAAGAAKKPKSLKAARGGKADNLKEIKGVGPKLEALLHGLGFFHFDQIAAWTDAELAWVDDNLEGFKGRASRDEWVAQAKVLAAGGETEFSKRVEKGEVYD
jgi:NADH-quinone oxidoreductase subunit E